MSPKHLDDDSAITNNKLSRESALLNRHNDDDSGGRKACDGPEEKGKATTLSQHDRRLCEKNVKKLRQNKYFMT